MTNKTSRRLLAASGAVAMAAASVSLFGGAAAQAQEGPGNIDTDTIGSLTINKFLHQDGDAEGTITGTNPGFTGPVAGVEFTVYPLLEDGAPVDLTDNEAWAGLNATTAGAGCTAPEGYTLGDPTVMPLTDEAGVSTVNLGVTAYQVCETDAPANIADRAAPFILTIPMPNGGDWLYDVNAFPKNGAVDLNKGVVEQDGLGAGAEVLFPVTSVIPSMEGDVWTGFEISDELDPRIWPNQDGDFSVTVDGVPLDEQYYWTQVDGQTVRMEFVTAGLDWLNTGAGEGQTIEVVFKGTVFDTVGMVNDVGDGVIENTAELWINNPTRDATMRPPLSSNGVSSNWGGFELTKTSEGTDDALAGATFEIYEAATPYADTCTTDIVGEALALDGVTEFTTGADGTVSFDGLFVSDSVNSGIDATERCYVVMETASPAGYVLPTGDAALSPVSVAIGDVTTDNITLANTQTDAPDLPLTGGAGTGAMLGLGAAFLLGAGGLALNKRRKDENEVVASA